MDAVVNDFVKQGRNRTNVRGNSHESRINENGFSDIQQAVARRVTMGGLVKDLSSLGDDLGLSTEDRVDALAHSLGLLPEDKHIEIDASGDVSAIENAKNAVRK